MHGTFGFQEYGGGGADVELASCGIPLDMDKRRNRTSNEEVIRRFVFDKDGDGSIFEVRVSY